jgi:sulfur-carrier protein
MAEITVRYWAAARAAAGEPSETVSASTLEDLLATLGRDRPALAKVLAICSFLVDGSRIDPAAPLADGAVVDALPPFAGG